jgi:hypothetical protein
MTRDNIIRMARVAGVRDDGHRFEFSEYKYLEHFAALVAAAEREACIDAMMQTTAIAVDAAMALEREACAKVAEQFEPDEKTSYVMYASKAIRARGNT